MKLAIVSDLHLEFRPTLFYIKIANLLNNISPDLVIIAGDTSTASKSYLTEALLDVLNSEVIFVSGNHDYYGSCVLQTEQELAKIASYSPKRHFLQNSSIKLGDYTFLGSCLWTNFAGNPVSEQIASKNISDFRVIDRFSTNDCVLEYEKSLNIIKNNITDPQKTVIVTHFAPSMRSCHEKYAGNPLNPYFCNNLDNFILDTKPFLWIHGHTHSEFDYFLGDTRVICNPLGYPGENSYFNVKVVDI